ncbi:MAG TPA: 50S ribosomal protein L25 [Candidatus Paceibacterota bacterium]|nr:50S ribosomal protein L25 [Candidatus Paceibacterota bacterium]
MELKVKERTVTGKKVKILRKEGLIPAELFGRGVENRHLAVSEKEFIKIYKSAGGHTIVYLVDEKGGRIPTLIADVKRHPLSFRPLSIDFHQVKMDEATEATVPIEFVGTAPAEKAGLVVVKVLHEIEVKSLPDKIPHSFIVDLTKLEKNGDSIHVSDLKMPNGVKVALSPETVIASATEKTKEEEIPTSTAPETVATSAPEKAETKEEEAPKE